MKTTVGHVLSVEATGTINQTMAYRHGMFEITDETVTGRQRVREVKCSCGETFDRRGWEIDDAKRHLKSVAWEAENLDDGKTPFEEGDIVWVHGTDQDALEVVEIDGQDAEVHLGQRGPLAGVDRVTLRSAIEGSRDDGHTVTVYDQDGHAKDI